MQFFTFTLFSFRNLVLVLIGVFTTRSLSANLDNFDGSLPSNPDGLELPSSFIFESLLQAQGLADELEFIPIPAPRSVITDILANDELFILTSDVESETEAWLGYLAPEGLPFDLSLNHAVLSLQTPSSSSQTAPPQPGQLGVTSLPLEQGSPTPGTGLPFEVFLGINLDKITSLNLVDPSLDGNNIPRYAISDFTSTAHIPEPSSVALLLGACASFLARRRRAS